jgi:cysteine desulfuration protein SufE
VIGCQSAVWLIGELQPNGTLALRCDTDSPMVKGLVHLLCEAYTGATPAEILATEPTFIDQLELHRDLSPTRRNGLAAVHARIKELARSALAIQNLA